MDLCLWVVHALMSKKYPFVSYTKLGSSPPKEKYPSLIITTVMTDEHEFFLS